MPKLRIDLKYTHDNFNTSTEYYDNFDPILISNLASLRIKLDIRISSHTNYCRTRLSFKKVEGVTLQCSQKKECLATLAIFLPYIHIGRVSYLEYVRTGEIVELTGS